MLLSIAVYLYKFYWKDIINKFNSIFKSGRSPMVLQPVKIRTRHASNKLHN